MSRRKAAAVLAAAVLTALVYSRAVRRIALGDEFQYIPRENVLLLATGDLQSLFQAAVDQFPGLVGDFAPEGYGSSSPLADLTAGVRESLEAKGLLVRVPDDLAKLGLDIQRGALVSYYRTSQDSSDKVLFVLPVSAQAALAGSLDRLLECRPGEKELSDTRTGKPYRVRTCGSWRLVFPQPSLAVLSNSEDLLLRSLSYRKENFQYVSNNDTFYQAVRRTLKGPLLVGPVVFVFWQTRSAPFGERAAALRFEPDGLDLKAEIELSHSQLRIVDDLLSASRDDPRESRLLPPNPLAMVTLHDEELTGHLRFLVEDLLKEEIPGSFEIPKIRRAAFAVTDFEDGLPDFLLGVWGRPGELDKLQRTLQRELRKIRDIGLLERALEEYGQQEGGNLSREALKKTDLLEWEDLFDRYPILPEGIGEPEFRAQDFSSLVYERMYRGHRIRFLAPPITKNDRRYHPELEKAGEQVVASDRYRMASVLLEDSLWVGSDLSDIHSVIDRAAQKEKQVQDRWFGGHASIDSKFRLFVDLDQATAVTWLNPETDLSAPVRASLADLRNHSALTVDILAPPGARRLRLSAKLLRKSF